ncbi:MAG: amidohydrolase [Verrucomicrobia bacterium]|nr:amidohydrolase [Verrucomicrobiota bacterium]
MRIIDFHTHLQDRWFLRPLPSETQFLDGMDRCGVEVSCIYTIMGFYGNCERENNQLANYARAHPKRIIPFATVDPKLGKPAVEELERCLSNPVFRGVKFHNWLQAFAPSMARETMIEILRCCARHDAPVVFHDGTPPYATTFQIAAMTRWVPEAKIVLGHGGLADYVYPAGQLLRDMPNLYICFCGPKAGDLPYLVEMAGADKVLFGSDFGFSDWKMLAGRLDDVIESGLDNASIEKILHGNAEQLLHLKERPL